MLGEQLGQADGILPDATERCHCSLVRLNTATAYVFLRNLLAAAPYV